MFLQSKFLKSNAGIRRTWLTVKSLHQRVDAVATSNFIIKALKQPMNGISECTSRIDKGQVPTFQWKDPGTV